MKAYKFIDGAISILLLLIYLVFTFFVSRMFDFLPWYDKEGGYMLALAIIWLPICIVTILQIAASFIAKHFDKPLVCLVSLNAVYIPIIFLLGFTDIPFVMIKTICVVAVITMITYIVLNFRRLKNL